MYKAKKKKKNIDNIKIKKARKNASESRETRRESKSESEINTKSSQTHLHTTHVLLLQCLLGLHLQYFLKRLVNKINK